MVIKNQSINKFFLQKTKLISTITASRSQGRPVRVKHDSYMHHGQNRGSKKAQIKPRNVNFAEIGRKCTNCTDIGGIKKCCGNRGKYAICVIGLEGCTPLVETARKGTGKEAESLYAFWPQLPYRLNNISITHLVTQSTGATDRGEHYWFISI